MPNKQAATLHLRRVHAEANMHRFYMLTIQPTLFGEASLIRNWGRIGASGQMMVQTFDSHTEALAAFNHISTRKKRRGYGSAAPDGRTST
ncbi:WGR domain-containing protein [Paracoccus denitrificans]|uniref:WGR domain-containing protein n=1 Tax=Paracoccus denitrificans TaxID=266 RepID=UPI000CEC15EB|nr:WGR domain-containing protein [Paracoccus denitrificans]